MIDWKRWDIKKLSKNALDKEKLSKLLLLKNDNQKHSRSNSYSNLYKKKDLYVKNIFYWEFLL